MGVSLARKKFNTPRKEINPLLKIRIKEIVKNAVEKELLPGIKNIKLVYLLNIS
jgi:hypothetical protein